jgi:hypothetical protein
VGFPGSVHFFLTFFFNPLNNGEDLRQPCFYISC